MSNPRKRRMWPIYLIGSSAAVAVWSGWVGLGEMSGFGLIHPLPGIWDAFHLNTAITLPIGVEAYGATALGAWLDPTTPKVARKFAKRSAIGSLALGMLGQIAYHLLTAMHKVQAPWEIVTVVSALPVITLGFAAALVHLLHLETEDEPEPEIAPTVAVELPKPTLADLPTADEIHERDMQDPAYRAAWEAERHPPTQAIKVLPPAPFDNPNWEPPKPVFTPVEGPETGAYPVQQPVGTVNVRSPLSRSERKVPYDERAPRTGSFQAIE